MNILRRHAYDIGAGFAALVWAVMPKRRRIAVDNVLKCGVAVDPGEARRIARKSFCHLAGHICEALCVPGVVDAGNWREHLDVETEASPEAVKLLLESPDTPIINAPRLPLIKSSTNLDHSAISILTVKPDSFMVSCRYSATLLREPSMVIMVISRPSG